MVTHLHVPSKRILAAARLAAIYAGGVTGLLLALYLTTASPSDRFLGDVRFFTMPFAVCFAAAFLVLGVAGRVGFTALSLLVFGVWAWGMLGGPGSHGTRPAADALLAWAILAAPLHAMIALGFPASAPSKWARGRAWATFSVWSSLLILVSMILRFTAWFRWPAQPVEAWWILQIAIAVLPPSITIAGRVRLYGDRSTGQSVA
jgi:hypothetical protein